MKVFVYGINTTTIAIFEETIWMKKVLTFIDSMEKKVFWKKLNKKKKYKNNKNRFYKIV